jgi:hypothetical protein
MMRINKIFTGILLFSFSCLLFSCKKSLVEKPYGFYNENQILKTATDARNLLLGAYNPLSNDYNMLRLPYWIAIDLDNDHVTGPAWLFGNTGSGNYTDFWGMNNIWQGHYQIIGRCNEVLNKVTPMDIDETTKNNILGEAMALRAWAYFSLVRMYGEVPIKTQTLEVDPNPNIPRSSIKDVYDFIIQDLTKADSMLLPKDDPKGGGAGRINKAAAQALLAKVYLTMASGAQKGASITVKGGKDNKYYTYVQNGVAGYDGFNSDSYFKLARNEAAEIIDGTGGGGQFNLVPNFKDVFSKAQQNGSEAIWYLEFKDGTNTVNPLNMYYMPTSVKRGYGGWVWLTDNFYNNYEQNDDRALYGVYHQFNSDIANPPLPFLYPQRDSAKYAYSELVTFPGGTTKEIQAKSLNRAYITKYSDVTNPDLENSDATIYMFRFADVLLMFAEAENEVNGPTAEAYSALNKIRERSHATDAPVGMNKEQFRSFVFEERDRELAQECNRRFDLIRRGIYLQVMNQIGIDQDNIVKNRQEKHLLYPLPQSEIDANNQINKNNPGW